MHGRRLQRVIFIALALLATTGLIPPATDVHSAVGGAAWLAAPQQNGSLLFVENAGQFASGARFRAKAGQTTIWVAADAIWLTVLERPPRTQTDDPPAVADRPRKGVNLKLSFVGASPNPRLEPLRRLDTRVSFFNGDDASRWRPNVPVWGGVRFVGLYPDMDLELDGAGGHWQARIVAGPKADLGAVRLRVEGASAVAINGGSLRLTTNMGDYSLPLLRAVDAAGAPLSSGAGPKLVRSNEVGAPFAASLLTQPRPSAGSADLVYSTFLGGAGDEGGYDIKVDASGASYIVGRVWSSDFPTTPGALDPTFNGGVALSDGLVAKLDPSGSTLIYATYLGGSSDDDTYAIALDSSGAAYVAGFAASSDFPTTAGAYDTTNAGGGEHGDAFVAKLDASGSSLVYSTFLGASDDEYSKGIAVDASGAAYVTGRTRSRDFPTTFGVDRSFNGGSWDIFVTKLNSSGSALVYSTFLGGRADELGRGIAVDASGNAYVTGWVESSNFPRTTGAFDVTYNGARDGFVTKLSADGSRRLYSTFLGGRSTDWSKRIVVDSEGAAYVVGQTASTGFPTTAGAFDTTYNGGTDAFVAKLNPLGSALVYSTFLGGSGEECGHACAIAVDSAGSAYVSGPTSSADFPVTSGAFSTTYSGNMDISASKLNPTGSTLLYSTYLGGSAEDFSAGIAVDGVGAMYVLGQTTSGDFPVTAGAFDTSFNGGADISVSKLSPG